MYRNNWPLLALADFQRAGRRAGPRDDLLRLSRSRTRRSLLLKKCTQKETFHHRRAPLHAGQSRRAARPHRAHRHGRGARRATTPRRSSSYFRLKALRPRRLRRRARPAAQGRAGRRLDRTTLPRRCCGFLRLLSGFDFASFCTVDEVAGTAEKRDWYARAHGGAGRRHGNRGRGRRGRATRQIPFLAVRVISDEYEHVLPVGALAAGFDASLGQARRRCACSLTWPGIRRIGADA